MLKGTSPLTESASLAGVLTANTEYKFRIKATNSGGTSEAEGTFKTKPNAPAVTGLAAKLTGNEKTSAELEAKVNPEGGETSVCKFEYGTSVVSEHSAPCSGGQMLKGASPLTETASLSGLLTADTEYKFRIKATNPGGTS